MSTDFTRREFAKLAGDRTPLLMSTAVPGIVDFGDRRPQRSQGNQKHSTQPTADFWGESTTTSDPSGAPMQRADELLRQMTIEGKAMQLSSVFPLALFDTEGTNQSQLDALLKNGIGHVSALGLIGHKTPEELAKSVNAIQRYLVTETRLKIPRSSTTRR